MNDFVTEAITVPVRNGYGFIWQRHGYACLQMLSKTPACIQLNLNMLTLFHTKKWPLCTFEKFPGYLTIPIAIMS